MHAAFHCSLNRQHCMPPFSRPGNLQEGSSGATAIGPPLPERSGASVGHGQGEPSMCVKDESIFLKINFSRTFTRVEWLTALSTPPIFSVSLWSALSGSQRVVWRILGILIRHIYTLGPYWWVVVHTWFTLVRRAHGRCANVLPTFLCALEFPKVADVAFLKTHKTASTTLAAILYRYAARHDLKVKPQLVYQGFPHFGQALRA